MTQTVHMLVMEGSSQSGGGNEDRLAVEEDMLKILCYRAEVVRENAEHLA